MSNDSFWTIIKADCLRYIGPPEDGLFLRLKRLPTAEGLIVVLFYRLIQLTIKKKIPLLPIILKILYWFLTIFFGIRISLKAKIGKGLTIHLYGGVFIGEAILGDNCFISNSVTIGYGHHGTPRIGSNVFIGPGAKIFGKINIGNNVSIGANTVISKNIPDNSIVIGNPGRIIGHQ